LGEIPIIEDNYTKNNKEEVFKMNIGYLVKKGLSILNDANNSTTAKPKYIENLKFIFIDLEKKLKISK
jgi:hypothetical protein